MEETRENVEEMRENVEETRENVEEMRENVEETRENVEEMREKVEETWKNVEERGRKRGRNVEEMRKKEGLIITVLSKAPKTTIKELVEITGMSHRGIEDMLKRMKQSGKIKRVGATKGGHWEVCNQ